MMKATFLAPALGPDRTFYAVFADIMATAAAQLDVELQLIDCRKSPDEMIERGRVVARRTRRPDYVLFPNYMGVATELLPVFDEARLPVFVVAEGIAGVARASQGEPRQKRRHWLGEILPPDVEAGYELAAALTRQARERGWRGADGKIHAGILSGDQSSAGLARYRGWTRLKGEESDVRQASFHYAAWERGSAMKAAALMLRDHPEIVVIWAANDAMALGAADAVREAGRVPGRDVLVGGIDLGQEALAEVAAGSLSVSIGGHFLDGALALILLHDHHQGRDFEPWSRHSSLTKAMKRDANRYHRFLEGRGWQGVDFTRFSRVRWPGSGTCAFSLDAIVAQGEGSGRPPFDHARSLGRATTPPAPGVVTEDPSSRP
jgi:DNA-binding LacI/PurR family transcriptional regulator